MAKHTSRTILADWVGDLGSIPPSSHDFVCQLCLGPVSSYRQCSACNEIYNVGLAPTAFRPGPISVAGKRVLLIEDSWTSGATAISAAGALLDGGAASVLIMPIARIIPSGFWPDDHPYRTAMKLPWDPDSDQWPRTPR